MQEDRNLLFGVFAVQLGKVSASALMEAAAAWAVDTSKSLAERLVERGALSGRDRQLIDSFVREAVAAHSGDAAAALETFGGAGTVARAFGDTVAPLEDRSLVARAAATVGRVLLADPTKTLPGITEFPGRYTRQSEHARGGMGRVLLVHDEHLGRDVALKELLPSKSSSGNGNDVQSPVRTSMAFIARFLQEARVTSQLEHPAIVPVYELGHRPDGTLYYTMKLVRGQSLSSAIRNAGSLRRRLELLPHFVDLCQAVSYAHSRNVLHRDIKPGNVMVGEFGETVLIDWGLAKVQGSEDLHQEELRQTLRALSLGLEKELAATEYGHALGTPAYMPPEQAKGQLEQIDERSDIYSLGAVLYELLTGRAPFDGKYLGEVLTKVISDDPVPVNNLEPKAPAELCAICQRAMAKDPTKRYANARELLEEMKRFQSGALVRAYRYTTAQRVARIVRHNKAEFATVAGAALMLLGGAVFAFAQITHERNLAVDAGSRERAARLEAESTGYFSSVLLAAAQVEKGDFGSAQETLWTTPVAMRGWEWGYLLRECNRDLRTIASPHGGLHSASLSPDGRKLALGTETGGVSVIDTASGTELYRAATSEVAFPTWATFSVDGSRLLVATLDIAQICDADTGKTISTMGGFEWLPSGEFRVSPDGRFIASLDAASRELGSKRLDTVQVWETETAELITKVTLNGDTIVSLDFHPRLNEILVTSELRGALIISATSGATVRSYSGSPEPLLTSIFSRDGQSILGGTSNGQVIVWRRESETPSRVYKLDDAAINSLAVHPTGENIVCAASGASAILFELSTERRLATFRGHSDSVFAVRFVNDGDEVMTAAYDGTVRFWRTFQSRRTEDFGVDSGPVKWIIPSAADGRIVLVSMDGGNGVQYFQVIDESTGQPSLVAAGFADQIARVDMSPDGSLLAVATSNKTVYLLDSATGHVVGEFRGHESIVRSVSFSPDGNSLLTASRDQTVRVWDVATRTQRVSLVGHSTEFVEATFVPDGSKVLTWDLDGLVTTWDANTGERLDSLPAGSGSPLVSAAVDPAGAGVWLADRRGALRFWEFEANQITRDYKIFAAEHDCLSVSPDGGRVALVSPDGAARVIETNSGRELLRLGRPGESFSAIEWSDDGRKMYLGVNQGRVYIREADPWRTEDLIPAQGDDWRSQYTSFKEKRDDDVRSAADEQRVVHTVTLTDERIRQRLARWAELIETSSDVEVDGDAASLTVDQQRAYPVLRRFGLIPGDILSRVGDEEASDPERAAELLRAASDPARPIDSISIVRNGVERRVDLIRREPDITHAAATMPRELAREVLDALPLLRQFSALLELQHRALSGQYDMPHAGPGMDGVWVSKLPENLSDAMQAKWARSLNEFFEMVGLWNLDQVKTVNGIPITSAAALVTAIEDGGEAIRSGMPYRYVLGVERSTFERVEIDIEIVD